MHPAALPSPILLGAVGLAAVCATLFAARAACRSEVLRARRVWVWVVGALIAVLAAVAVAAFAVVTGRDWPSVPIELCLAAFAGFAQMGAVRASVDGGLPGLRTALDVVPPGLAAGTLSVLEYGHDVDAHPSNLISRLLVPVIAGSLVALTLEAVRGAGGRRASLNVVLLAGGFELCAVMVVIDSLRSGQLADPVSLVVWAIGLSAVATAAARRAEAPAAAVPAADSSAIGSGGIGAIVGVIALLAMDAMSPGNDPEWQYALTALAMVCMTLRFTIDRAAVRRLLGEVRQAEQRYRTLVEQLPLVTYVARLGADAGHVYTSPQVVDVLGYGPEAWQADPRLLTKLLHPEDRDRVLAGLAGRRAEVGREWLAEYRLIARDGRVVWIEDRTTVVRDAGSDGAYAQGYLRDITDRKLAEQSLREGREELADSERRFREILENVQLLAITFDVEGRITFVNEHLCAVTGWDREELIGRPLLGTLADDPQLFEKFLTRMRGGSVPAHVERTMRTRTGEELVIAWSDTMIRDRAGRVVGVTGLGEDITGRRRAERRIAYLSQHDELTGLPNRVAFSDRAAAAVDLADRQGRSVGVLFVDIDNFTLVNDGYSHAAGDTLLRQLAERLSAAAGRGAEMVARHSGDEFLVLLADTAAPGAGAGTHDSVEQVMELANAAADRIRAALRSPFMVGGDAVYLAVQIGISVFPRDARDTNQLLSRSHIASYGPAHGGGRPSRASTGLPPREELRMISQLHQAIERDELVLHYQPVVELGTRRMRGVEALLRWRSPDGLVPPNTFIPLAERTGLIAPITEWVVDQVCRQRLDWAARGIDLEMAFNFPAALWEPAVIRDLLATIDRHGVDPAGLLVEITESTAMMETAGGEALIELITSSGLRLAIDDFGTGYSSLSRLKQLPCRTLKVDRSFVRDLADDADSAAMTVAIVQLAGNLGLEALAEGIETEAQAAFLASLGCNVGQGFLFGRPLPADELEALWRQGLRRAA